MRERENCVYSSSQTHTRCTPRESCPNCFFKSAGLIHTHISVSRPNFSFFDLFFRFWIALHNKSRIFLEMSNCALTKKKQKNPVPAKTIIMKWKSTRFSQLYSLQLSLGWLRMGRKRTYKCKQCINVN